MLDAGKKNMENNNLYDALNMYNKAVVFAPNIDDNLGNTQIGSFSNNRTQIFEMFYKIGCQAKFRN